MKPNMNKNSLGKGKHLSQDLQLQDAYLKIHACGKIPYIVLERPARQSDA